MNFDHRFIGAVLSCNGICDAIFSYVFGGLVKYIGRLGCFIIAAALNYGAIFLMYFWDPQEDQVYVLYIIAGLWGIADAAWQSQVVGMIHFLIILIFLYIFDLFSAVYTVLYAETDSSAIAKYRLWKAVGSLVTYSVNSSFLFEKENIYLFFLI